MPRTTRVSGSSFAHIGPGSAKLKALGSGAAPSPQEAPIDRRGRPRKALDGSCRGTIRSWRRECPFERKPQPGGLQEWEEEDNHEQDDSWTQRRNSDSRCPPGSAPSAHGAKGRREDMEPRSPALACRKRPKSASDKSTYAVWSTSTDSRYRK